MLAVKAFFSNPFFRGATTMNLKHVAGWTLALCLGWASLANAELMTKDSADFGTQYTGAQVIQGGDWTLVLSDDGGADYSIVGDALQLVSDGSSGSRSGWYTWNNAANLDGTTGWTMEMSFKIVTPNPAAEEYSFGLIASSDATADGTYYSAVLTPSNVYNWETQASIGTYSGDHTDAFHTIRIAQPATASGETPVDAEVWIDGVSLGTMADYDTGSATTLAIGRTSGAIIDGATTQVEWVRVDTGGAYAPVPEPGTLALLAFVAIMGIVVRRRR
jgi:hypothetical protein